MTEGQTETYLRNDELYSFKLIRDTNPDGSPHSILTLSVRDQNILSDSKYYPDNVINRYNRLKELALPVPQEFVYDQDSATYTMSAPANEATKIYGIGFQKNPIITSIEDIKQQLDRIATTAADSGILLNEFAYAITVDNGIGRVVLLNILEGSYLPSSDIAENPERMNKISKSAVKTFFETLFPNQTYSQSANRLN